MSKKIIRALTIAGFDGSGGAGIQADIKTFSALGCYAMSVLTALPVQNTLGVQSIYQLPLNAIEEQCRAIFDDIGVDVVKIGMVFNDQIIEVISKILIEYSPKIVVLDPVMVAKSGHDLLEAEAIDLLVGKLFPLSDIVTPNIPEASKILEKDILEKEGMLSAVEELLKFGSKSAIIKGGHADSLLCEDVLYWQGQKYRFSTERINTINNHGTGCTFSAAIAAFLGHGFEMPEAVEQAKKYLTKALVAYKDTKIGKGHGPVDHFFSYSSTSKKIS